MKMKKIDELDKIVLIGGGGHCKSVIDTIRGSYNYTEIAISDGRLKRGDCISGCYVSGGDDQLEVLMNAGYKNAVITVGSVKVNTVRRDIFNKVCGIGFYFPNIVDKSANVSASAKLGRGCFIGKNTIVNSEVVIGDFSIINTGSIIEHECQIGDFSHIATGAIVCGGCWVGNDVFIGAGSTIIQGLRIGNNTNIGAGSLVLANVPDNTWVYGIWKGSKTY